jgi:hypothetical protein
VLSQGVAISLRNIVPFLALSMIVHLPIYVGLAILLTRGLDLSSPDAAARSVHNIQIYTWFNVAATFVLQWVLTSALIFGVVRRLSGAPAAFGEILGVGLKRLFPSLAVGLLSGLLIAAGIVMLIVPGVMWACTYWLAVPVSVIEAPGVGASFERSKRLTDGLRGKIFGIVLVLGVTGAVFNFLVTKLGKFSSDPATNVAAILIGSAVVTTVFSIWNSTTIAVGYYEVRRVKENIDIAQVAAVFD